MELEHCCKCGEVTGRAGKAENSLYIGDCGPFCEWCFDGLQPHEPEDLPEEVRAAIVTTAVVNHAHPLTNGLVGAWLFNDGQAVQVYGQTVQMEEEDPLEPEDIDRCSWPAPRVRNSKGTY